MKKTLVINIPWELWLKLAMICAKTGSTYTRFILTAITEKIDRERNQDNELSQSTV